MCIFLLTLVIKFGSLGFSFFFYLASFTRQTKYHPQAPNEFFLSVDRYSCAKYVYGCYMSRQGKIMLWNNLCPVTLSKCFRDLHNDNSF